MINVHRLGNDLMTFESSFFCLDSNLYDIINCRKYNRVVAMEKKLDELITEMERYYIHKSYYTDDFHKLSDFLLSKLGSPICKNRNIVVVANNFDRILPYICAGNIDIILLHIGSLLEQSNFKEKFRLGLKKYPYKEELYCLFYSIASSLSNYPERFDSFMDEQMLELLASLDTSWQLYIYLLNRLNERSQGMFLKLLAQNKRNIGYHQIEYKGDNKQIVYDNLHLFIENSQNLYDLLDFIKDNPEAYSKTKKYIDEHEDDAINSIFCETGDLVKITEPTIKELIRLIVLEVAKNEAVNLSDINYNGGGFSRVLLIGEKVVKIGSRFTKTFPNNPYIISPLLRQEFNINGESCFVEVTERVDTTTDINTEDLYQLFKNLRDLGLIWTDIKQGNVGRLRRDNVIHWNDPLEPSDAVLCLENKRGNAILEAGDLVILDADFIYDENASDINYTNHRALVEQFETRYQREKALTTSADAPIIDECTYVCGNESSSFHRK